jgi:hypothetical protein
MIFDATVNPAVTTPTAPTNAAALSDRRFAQ